MKHSKFYPCNGYNRNPEKNFEGYIGKSDEAKRIRLQADIFASDIMGSHILITGEEGVGKEVIARQIHKNSVSVINKNVFVACNCGGFPEGLAESELFGHEKGSFTGAIGRHIGVFEQAEDGTLFLDEIGNLDLRMQGMLMRVIEYGTFQRVGGETEIKFKGRVIFATNKDLREMCRQGLFRSDLLSRIDVLQLYISPLRERREDIRALIEFNIAKFQKIYAPGIRVTMEPGLEDCLLNYSYPGNARETGNMFQDAFIKLSYYSSDILLQEYFEFKNEPAHLPAVAAELNYMDYFQLMLEALTKHIIDNRLQYRNMKSKDLPVLFDLAYFTKKIILTVFLAALSCKIKTARFLGLTTDQLRKLNRPD
jgi:transcriptional regulator with GAF, ATPase, and Fis domain